MPGDEAHGDGRTGPDEDGIDPWVVVGSYRFRGFASFVASALEGNGIPARVIGDDANGVLPGVGVLTGGIHVEVASGDLEAARDLLDSLPPPDEDLDGWRDDAGDERAHAGDDGAHAGVEGARPSDGALGRGTDEATGDVPTVSRSTWRGVLIGVLVVVLVLTVGLAVLELG